MPSPSDPKPKNAHAQKLGRYGEQLVCQWLASKRCQVLQQQWHSRFGEIDLIAKGYSGQGALKSETLAFIEVKTRSQGNWDADGLLAVTRTKQKKIRITARYFLARYPHLAELPCRFDIALVVCRSQPPTHRMYLEFPHPELPDRQQYLTIQAYLRNAF